MKRCHMRLLAALFCLMALQGNAQGPDSADPATDTIRWYYGDIRSVIRSERVNIGGHFVSYGSKQLVWIQDGIDRTYTFDVIGVEGEWHNASKEGSLIYKATCLEVDGTIRISRQRKGLKIELDFSHPDKQTPRLDFDVTRYTKM